MGSEALGWQEKVALRAAEMLPGLISQTPVIGESAKKLLSSLGYEQGIADSYFNSILRNLSLSVDKCFTDDAIGLEGGLVYSKSGTNKSNFIVSRSVAAYLNSITDPAQKPLALKSLVIALLHERMWQCKDSASLYDAYSIMPLYEGIKAITGRLQKIVSLAIDIRDTVLVAVSRFEPASEMFKLANGGSSVYEHCDKIRAEDIFTESAQSECISLSTCPSLLIERYIDIFASHGDMKFYYIPFTKPLVAPDKASPPMLKFGTVKDRNSSSPGLAIDNVIQIVPFPFLDMQAAKNDSNSWPYGKEVEAGYINLNPPFEFWCDKGISEKPAWAEDRVPDMVVVAERENAISTQEWDEYVTSAAKGQDLSFE